jgi:hypothetical protein
MQNPGERGSTYNGSNESGRHIADVHPGKHNVVWNSLETTIKELVEFSSGLVERVERVDGL